ncbi:hypothetical protein H5410_021610 [Solanum commersonii]|uniref:Uncharacterized protein n=1 Tax=Solanum commersonii TaxID=4109 RepID=A0A9J5ZBU0_SOLCO|nr:hypothetical protein H5410_021610 [Solanum commersonii]
MYMLDVIVDRTKPILKINIILRCLVPLSPHRTIDDDDSIEDKSLGDHGWSSQWNRKILNCFKKSNGNVSVGQAHNSTTASPMELIFK